MSIEGDRTLSGNKITISDEKEAERYLNALLKMLEYRNMGELSKRAEELISDLKIRKYFLDLAVIRLKEYGLE